MVGVGAAAGLVALVGLHTLVAAIATRFFRVRLSTRWAPVVFALAFIPVLLVASTLVVTGGLGLGPDLGSPGLAVFILVIVPLGLGLAVDYLWMPAPADVELPTIGER